MQITLNSGRTVEMKQRFYKAVADGLHESLKLRREDVFISLVEVQKENWSLRQWRTRICACNDLTNIL